jgi:PPOX class probable F420-dependent enzyme
MEILRPLERRMLGVLRHKDAVRVMDQPARPWSSEDLRGHRHVLLVTWKRDGTPVPTPVWFAVTGETIVVRSGAEDGKVKRVRNNGRAAVAPCNGRGKPQAAPMLGTARMLDGSEAEAAERALRDAIGLPRRVYDAARGSLPLAYLEVRG